MRKLLPSIQVSRQFCCPGKKFKVFTPQAVPCFWSLSAGKAKTLLHPKPL